MDITKEQLSEIIRQTAQQVVGPVSEQVIRQIAEPVWSSLNKPVARDRDRNILNSDEEILKAAENGDLPDDFDYMAFNNCKDKWGETPAHLAARNGHLLDDFDYVASQGMTP